MPDIFRTGNLSDAVVLTLDNGDREHIAWCSQTLGRAATDITVPRMPVTPEEQVWFWRVLPTRLKPGASIRLRKPR